MGATHEINTWLTQSLSAGRQFELAVTANLVDLYFVNYQINWGFVRNLNLTTQFNYQHGLTTGGGVSQVLDIYGGGAGVSYNITRKLIGSLNYNLQIKKANPSIYNYTQNLLVFDLKYGF